MWRYLLKRIFAMVPVLWVVATLTFFFIRMAPGGPFDSEKKIPEEILREIEIKYHLDKPLHLQYMYYLRDLMKGDLGPSYRYPVRTVNEIIYNTFPASALVGIFGLLFALVVGVVSGIIAAYKPHTIYDYTSMFFSMIGCCLPSFVIGPILVSIFSVKLHWFNVSGWSEMTDVVLPAITLGTLYAAFFSRLMRDSILEVVQQEFIRTAKAKGLANWKILFRHTLKSACLPVVSFFGPASAAMLTGSLVVETIFNIPGMGRFFVQAALNRDYTLVMGCTLFVAVIVMVTNLLVDILYLFLDPRVSYD